MNLELWGKWRNELPPMDEYNFYTKYLGHGELSEDELRKLRKDIYDAFSQTTAYEYYGWGEATQKVMDQKVEKFVQKVKAHPPLYHFVYDTDHAAMALLDSEKTRVYPPCSSRLGSDFFINWIADQVPRSIALEVCYGFGEDLAGEYREFPETDPFRYFTYKNDLFVAIVKRGLKSVEWIREEEPKRILFLGAGMAPEFRHLGLTLEPGQEAFLVDNDPTINPERLLSGLEFGEQMTYLKTDFKLALLNPTLDDLDMMVANGFISYVWDTHFQTILMMAQKKLKPGGSFVFELYPDHWEWWRNKSIGGFYLPLKLFPSIDEATEALFRELKLANIPTETVDIESTYDDFGKELMVQYRIRMP